MNLCKSEPSFDLYGFVQIESECVQGRALSSTTLLLESLHLHQRPRPPPMATAKRNHLLASKFSPNPYEYYSSTTVPPNLPTFASL
jgi:hypothetical protein